MVLQKMFIDMVEGDEALVLKEMKGYPYDWRRSKL